MKKAVILHGTGGKPNSNWFMWLKRKFEAEGYEVWVPQLPDCDRPNRDTYGNFLFGSGWDFNENIVVGHSSGAVEVLNLLMDARLPHIKMAVMAGAWSSNDLPDDYRERLTAIGLTKEQFQNTFPAEGFNFELIKSKADHIAFIHGSDDPYCPIKQAQFLAEQLDASFTPVPNGHHLGAKYTELPELWQIIKPYL